MQDAVTTMLSGVDPQLEKDVGETVILIISGWLDEACRVTGETDGLQVKESGALPEKVCTTENLMSRGRTLQVTGNEAVPVRVAEAK